MQSFFAVVGFLCIFILLLGTLDVIHGRVYVGVEDKLKDPTE